MREILAKEQKLVAGGVVGVGPIPGFGSKGGPIGITFGASSGSGWSLSAGFAQGGARGMEVRYVW